LLWFSGARLAPCGRGPGAAASAGLLGLLAGLGARPGPVEAGKDRALVGRTRRAGAAAWGGTGNGAKAGGATVAV
jgi:hypothetical protein